MIDSRRTHLIEVVIEVEKYMTLRMDTENTAFGTTDLNRYCDIDISPVNGASLGSYFLLKNNL